jgi:ATP-binding cassette subfamily F protein 3
MLTISNLTKSYGTHVIFQGAGFTLTRGERVGLVGRNGSGKTTLMKMILREAQPDSGSIDTPSGYRLGHLRQHISFTRPTSLREAAGALPPQEDGRDETYKAESVLMGLGFSPEMMEADPYSLSGGFQVRLNLARALLSEPDLLLLDEPTNYLDILSIRWLREFLRSWPREFILITHDRDFMDSVTTHTVGINQGRLIKVEGGTDKFYGRILMEEEHHEKERLSDERKRKEAERFINRFRAQATRARAVQSRIKQLGKMDNREKLPQEQDLSFSFNYRPFTGKWMMEVHDLSFGYQPSEPLIEGLTMRIRPGDRIAVIGRNGAGKSTLLNLLAGELRPSSGNISLNAKSALSYFGQTNVERLHPGKTVVEEIMDANPALGQKLARDIAGGVMFEGDAALKKTSVLSGGERSRVLLGRILAAPANLLLLDEPSNHLDAESVDSLMAAIDNFRGAVIIVTHSEMILRAVAERLIVFDGGRVFPFEGSYDDFLRRHGFSSEGEPGAPLPTDSKTASSLDRRELKRLKAELINERSRALNPKHELVAASTSGDAEGIAELSIKMHTAKERIEVSFSELAALSEEHDRLSADFEQRLEELG